MTVAASLHKLSPDTGHSSTDNAEHCTLYTTVILHATLLHLIQQEF